MAARKKSTSLQDTTPSGHPEDRFANLNRTYALLSAINQAIVRVREPQALFEEACRAAVETGGFLIAWIGFLDPELNRVKPIAIAGVTDGFLEILNTSLQNSEKSQGPTAAALRTGTYRVVNDIATDPHMAHWREDALRLGLRSSASFPILVPSWKPGSLTLYAAEANFFDKNELDLLDEMAHDIAFALEFAGQEAQKQQAEQLLRESEYRYHTLASISPVGIFRTDTNGSTTYVNPQWCSIASMSFDAAMGDGWLEAVHPDDRARLMQGWRESTVSGKTSVTEYRFLHPDGSIAWVMGRAVPEYAPDNKVAGYVGTITDITERKQAEAALKASERQLSLIYENISDVLFYLAVEGEDRYRFITVNKAFLKVTGLQAGQVEGKPVLEVIPPPAHKLVLGNYRKAIQTKKAVRWEEISEYPAGRKYGEVSVIPIVDADGSVTHLIGTVHDITERKQSEEQIQKLNADLERRVLERTIQLETLNKELESFSYSVSHDLRAPLRAISGFSEIISRRHRDDLNEEGRHYVDNIVQASERMGRLIDDLLTYARLGRTGVRVEPVSLKRLLKDIQRNLQVRLVETGGRLNLPEDLPTVRGDQTLLMQVFTNLLENALKYTRAGAPPQIWLTYTLEDEHIVVQVRDNGIGIPAEYQEKIFNMFQRLHTEEEYPGTGIGLASVKKSVELLGGSVWVESKEGEGSTFFVRLPRE
jgi:PAS domain S-box-containing protein